MPHFDALKIYSCRKNCEKREIACNKQPVLFSQCFLPCMALIFHFECTLKCLFQLDLSKILSPGNGLKNGFFKNGW